MLEIHSLLIILENSVILDVKHITLKSERKMFYTVNSTNKMSHFVSDFLTLRAVSLTLGS